MYRTDETTAMIPAGEYIRDYRDAAKFIGFCKACNRYGNCWACPPHGFDPDEYLGGYRTALVVGTRIIPDEAVRTATATPQQCIETGERIIAGVRQALDERLLEFERRHPDSRAFFAGTCHWCPPGTCTRIGGETCRHPDKIRPSLESLGFDIGKTSSELLGIELKWSDPGTVSLPEYYTLVSGLFINDQTKEGLW